MTARRIDICICTFRRAELANTLRSIARLRVPEDCRLAVIVADNDGTPSARPLVEIQGAALDLRVTYRHCPARNISVARNGCLDASSGDFIAFVDDDEVVTPGWLEALVATADAEAADVVLGPVRACYAPTAPGWMHRGDFHSTYPVWVGGTIRTGYTCNALLRMSSPAIAGRRFDPARGRSGGEDTDFFDRVHAAGGRIAFARDAWVEERVPPGRASFSWLARRRFRSGQTHGHLLGRRRSGAARPAALLLATAKAGYCFAAMAVCAPSAVLRNRYALRGIMHAGVVGGLLGMAELQQYGQAGAGHAA